MKSYLNSLNEREKWMVIGAVLCLILYGYYLLLYHPLSNQTAQKSKQLTEKKSTLQWMQTVKQQKPTTQIKENINNSQLLTVLATQLKSDPTLKFPYQLQQTGSGDVQLTFDAVPFNQFINWLEKINKRYAITIKQFEANSIKTVGVSRLMIVISAISP